MADNTSELKLNARITALLPDTVGNDKREGAAKKFEVIGLHGHEKTTKIGLGVWDVDFGNLSAAKAARLVKEGFPYLRPRTVRTEPKGKAEK